MTIADEARDNALHCEMVKYAYRQTRDGVVVSFVVHPNDIPAALSTAHIGARYMVALVQIGDDEHPIKQPAKEKATPATPQPNSAAAGAKRLSMIAALRCGDATFRAFLREECAFETQDKDQAAIVVGQICQAESRMPRGKDEN